MLREVVILKIEKAYQLGSLLASKRKGVVAFIPLSEGGSIDHNNGVFHQSLGADQLVV